MLSILSANASHQPMSAVEMKLQEGSAGKKTMFHPRLSLSISWKECYWWRARGQKVDCDIQRPHRCRRRKLTITETKKGFEKSVFSIFKAKSTY